MVNLIHYEDAASLCVAALRGGSKGEMARGKVYLGCDNHPIRFDDMMRATEASGKFPGASNVQFTGQPGGAKGKLANNDRTRADLGWQPVYPSYEQFMTKMGADDVYTRTDAGKLGMKHA